MLQALDDAAVGAWYRAAVEALSASREPARRPQRLPGARRRHRHQPAARPPRPPSPPSTREGARTTESAWSVLARGAVLGARGNSGTILAQLLRGLADQLAGQPPADGPALAAALQKAADTAYTAVADPEEGTFLTVARAGAEAAVAAVDAGPRRAGRRRPGRRRRRPRGPGGAPRTSSTALRDAGRGRRRRRRASAWSSTRWSPP